MTMSVVETLPKATISRTQAEAVRFERQRQSGVRSVTLKEDAENWILETALEELKGIKPIGGWPQPG
jgi:hypothetical protein